MKSAFDSSSKKFICPCCDKKRFVRLVDENGNYLSDEYGKCDRQEKCGYSKYPNKESTWLPITPAPRPAKEIKFLEKDHLDGTLDKYDGNSFAQWLIGWAGKDKALQALKTYNVGTSKDGWCIFWQVDEKQRIRTGHLMKYKGANRAKDGYSQNWIHSLLNIDRDNIEQCLFGLHLVGDDKPIGIVESEKTAIIASIMIPDYIWMATCGSSGLNKAKLKPLRGRRVVVYPDQGQYDKWSEKASEVALYVNLDIEVSDFIELNFKDDSGIDLADILVKESPVSGEADTTDYYEFLGIEKEHDYLSELQELLDDFNGIDLPEYLQLDCGSRIFDLPKYIESNASIIRNYGNRKVGVQCMRKLHTLLEVITNS